MKETKQGETKYKKQELLKAERYRERKDLVGALLKDGREYSLEEVDAVIDKFVKGKVK